MSSFKIKLFCSILSLYSQLPFLAYHDKLFSTSKAVQEKLKKQIKDVDVVQSKEVHLFWSGVAEVSFVECYLLIIFGLSQ